MLFYPFISLKILFLKKNHKTSLLHGMLLVLFGITLQNASANTDHAFQNKTVSGQVTGVNGEILQGVSITLKGTTTGATAMLQEGTGLMYL